MDKETLKFILTRDNPSLFIKDNEQWIFKFIPELKKCKGFNQNNIWHPYDVYEHTLHVIDNVENDYILRLTALFHDLGKPETYTEDENGVGHFYGHYQKSKEIFDEFASKQQYEESIRNITSTLIYYHDINIDKMTDEDFEIMFKYLGRDNLIRLFKFKRADLLAQNEMFHEQKFQDYDRQEKYVLEKNKLRQL